jgi:protein-S-isoprenylcysteine O-methyltransferase Ste14
VQNTGADSSDIPHVLVPVPAILPVTIGVGLIIDKLWWIGLVGSISRPWRVTIAALLWILGVWLVWKSAGAMRRVGTHVRPWIPTSDLARDGIYTRMRNPMYVGFFCCALGLAFIFRSDWSLILMVPLALLVHFGVVLREERYLDRKFGEDYRCYMRAVPRYGVPLRWRLPPPA